MLQYFFILGREPELSVAEIWQVAKNFNIKLTEVLLTREFLIVEADNLDVAWWQERLGGVIKIGEIIGSWEIAKEELVLKIKQVIKPAPQLYFGFSWYGALPKWINALGLEVKKMVKGQGKVRYVISRDKILSSVTVQKNHLLPPMGYEFVFMPNQSKMIVGRTITVQPFAEFSQRDFDRPSRDSYVGMLPPKLARMMINLSANSDNLLDPFCGSGTILQEAALLGIKKLVGSDSSAEAVERTKTNLQWLQKKNPNITPEFNILHSPLESLVNMVKQKFSTIVCEPFLGKPMTGREKERELQLIVNDLMLSYSRWLKLLSNFLTSDGRLVMVWPAIVKSNDFILLPLMDVLKQAGLKVVDIIPDFLPKEWLSPRGTLFYHRPGQKIAREIIVLGK
ncbi:MAG: DNA methyltransferase [Patescibacteria group bacterium]